MKALLLSSAHDVGKQSGAQPHGSQLARQVLVTALILADMRRSHKLRTCAASFPNPCASTLAALAGGHCSGMHRS